MAPWGLCRGTSSTSNVLILALGDSPAWTRVGAAPAGGSVGTRTLLSPERSATVLCPAEQSWGRGGWRCRRGEVQAGEKRRGLRRAEVSLPVRTRGAWLPLRRRVGWAGSPGLSGVRNGSAPGSLAGGRMLGARWKLGWWKERGLEGGVSGRVRMGTSLL